MNPNALNVPLKTLTVTILLSLLTACGSDDNNSVAPPPENAAPIAQPDTAEAVVGTQLTNDSDADSDTLT